LELSVPDAEIRARQVEFAGAFSREERRLFGVALSILRDAHEAEDAVQETAFLAWRAWDDVRAQDLPGPWLTRICVNECLRWRRRHLRWRLASSADVPDLISEHIVFDERSVDLDRAHRRLSRRQRAVVVLHYQHHGDPGTQPPSARHSCRAHWPWFSPWQSCITKATVVPQGRGPPPIMSTANWTSCCVR
jgi:RNA polymerase sigma factor (sigma-70 family)